MMTSTTSLPATLCFSSPTLSTSTNGCDEEDATATSMAVQEPEPLSLRLVKRPLPNNTDSCKKRRKQSTPIRISTTGLLATDEDDDTDELPTTTNGGHFEGKLGLSYLSSPIQSPFESIDSKLADVKIEPIGTCDQPDYPVNLSGNPSVPLWMTDMQPGGKSDDWLSVTSASTSVARPSSYYPPTGDGSKILTQPPIRIFNPEAYCELCNKEFCNKYFLKTHKANKHRIYNDPPMPEQIGLGVGLGMPVNVPNFTALPLKKPTTCLPLNSDGTPALVSVLSKNDSDKSYLNEACCDICSNTFCNVAALQAHKTTAHEQPKEICDQLESDSNHVEITVTPTEIIKEEPVPPPLPPAPDNQDETEPVPHVQQAKIEYPVNHLRRLGVMNPEAFCEICCKEYCNKYFLRTHKMKRHGILITDENSKDPSGKDLKLELSISNTTWYHVQTSPLNLIMGEQQNTNSSSSYGGDKKSANDNECDICGLRFQTLYMAQVHAATAQCKRESAPGDFVIKSEEGLVNINNNTQKNGPGSGTSGGSADSISEDLQKLQTMILQLNDLDVSRVSAVCTICNKELENRYYLHVHMMTEHGVLLDEDGNKTDADMSAACKICGRDGFTSIDTLRQHIIESHDPTVPVSVPVVDPKEDVINDLLPLAAEKAVRPPMMPSTVPGERRLSVSHTPTSSYCDICNKELCNKYFMKTHMQRMHGIEIENGAQIGGVICNICNKELCSKYFLRVHKHNTHGIVEDGSTGSGAATLRLPTELDTITQQQTQPQILSASADTFNTSPLDPSLKPADLSDLSNRYFTYFTEVCTICSRRFRSTKWLKTHLIGEHGKAGIDKWNELEQQLQKSVTQQQPPRTSMNKMANSGRDRNSPTLRIPNGANNGHLKPGVQNVLSNLFGSDDANVKQYHCSFCSFSTPVLAFLFVHEKSHVTGLPANVVDTSTDGSTYQCTVCQQSFSQADKLHRHVMQQHPFLSLGTLFGNLSSQSPFAAPEIAEAKVENVGTPELEHQCTQCIKMRKNAPKAGVRYPHELSSEVSSTLKDVSKQRQMPATYALPQRFQQQTNYMMQAFLMDEPSSSCPDAEVVTSQLTTAEANVTCSSSSRSEQHLTKSDSSDRKFAPSIVFLPVLERQTAPLTVSFTLTPA